MAISQLMQMSRMLQKKRKFNPLYGRELLMQAAMADAEGASQRLASGKRLDLAERRQDIQKEQFATRLATEKGQFTERLATGREQFALTLAEQKRASQTREQQARTVREAQIKAASRARTQSYIGMGLQAPVSYYTLKQLTKPNRYDYINQLYE